ncbi:MAG: ATP-dependent DNA helicase UvrD2 [Actinomycetota bacterium]|nr:ATP-dependent DNA helicase UvrD2 [Actinomycetota bacterium]
MDVERIIADLNPEQRRAVEAVRGPVCILAGAGSGKTTTITRRVAYQVATGTFAASEILAVTFTDKAAGEMKARLAALGVDGVAARTFHSAALGQLRYFAPDRVGKILASKAVPLRRIANSLPPPYKFRPAGDLATEVEWAKNRRIPPERYVAELGDHEPPIPHDLMARVYHRYEERKAEAGFTDFEDLLELAIRLFDEDEWALSAVRDRYRAFTVDEYQDVNLLQQTLLDRWLGARDDLCVVGDDYQSIYAFTGAGPEHLLSMRTRFPHATVVLLETNYRSSPQVLELANRLVPRLGGAPKVLRASRPDGPEPEVRPFANTEAEADFVVDRIRALRDDGVPLESIALLCRTNARLGDFEEPLHDAGIPFQGAALLSREAARMLLRKLSRTSRTVAADVRAIADELGWLPAPPDKLGERELTRQNDLGRLVRLAAEFDDGSRSGADFVADLEQRFGSASEARRGVHLLTLHGAKGLEFEAVFIPRVEERELPVKFAKTDPEIDEERRLFYVGLTRAKRHLAVTWTRRPSRFLLELRVDRSVETPAPAAQPTGPEYEALRAWRLRRAKADDLPAYVIFHNNTLAEIAARQPASLAELATVPGVGPTKLERYGDEVLAALRPG